MRAPVVTQQYLRNLFFSVPPAPATPFPSNAMIEAADEEPFNPLLTDIHHHLQSLSESIAHVQILKGKWSLITTKLITLQNRLFDLSIPAAAAENPLSADLLRSLSATCSAASSLAAICLSPTPPGGKLKTQSEVDSLFAKLDAHINDLEVLFKSGVLSENAAVPLPAIVSSSRR
ncbi:UNVERIFIED_CONTAM: hypothetical protein Slati_2893000 [Sesamum latifolium]|uniref:DUF7032 domain-containing protein n=1 Tax=Sesamum latifolium TaxID=2727402 RepID=A0AAW2VCS0_9LAMI